MLSSFSLDGTVVDDKQIKCSTITAVCLWVLRNCPWIFKCLPTPCTDHCGQQTDCGV